MATGILLAVFGHYLVPCGNLSCGTSTSMTTFSNGSLSNWTTTCFETFQCTSYPFLSEGILVFMVGFMLSVMMGGGTRGRKRRTAGATMVVEFPK